MATGVIYLRPSADISVGHVKTPSDSASAYLLINEEVSDGATTHIDLNIKGDNGATGSATSQFSMSGNLPENPKYTITGAKCGISAALGDAQTSGNNSVTATFTINGTNYTAVQNSSMTKEYLLFELDMPDVVSAINEYVTQQGTFPAVTVSLTSAGTSGGSSSNKEYTVLMVSQIYLELSYDAQTDIGVHMKINGEWKAATQAYRKVNGAWVEIIADECKTILQNSFCVIP